MRWILILLILTSNNVFSQKIEENKVDEFTKNKVIRTSWEILSKGGMFKGTFCHTRVSYINGTYYLDFKLMEAHPIVESILKNADIMFKLGNDSILTMNNVDFSVSCTGCGAVGLAGSAAEGLGFSAVIDNDDIDDLKILKITKCRVYLSDGYDEMEIDPKRSEIISKELKLIQSKL